MTPDRAAAVSNDMLADVPLPPGFDKAALTKLGTNDRYQFAAQIKVEIEKWGKVIKAAGIKAD